MQRFIKNKPTENPAFGEFLGLLRGCFFRRRLPGHESMAVLICLISRQRGTRQRHPACGIEAFMLEF